MLWVVCCDLCPKIFFKSCKNEDEVKARFEKGLKNKDKYYKHPSFKIMKITTLRHLLDYLDIEDIEEGFKIDYDGSF